VSTIAFATSNCGVSQSWGPGWRTCQGPLQTGCCMDDSLVRRDVTHIRGVAARASAPASRSSTRRPAGGDGRQLPTPEGEFTFLASAWTCQPLRNACGLGCRRRLPSAVSRRACVEALLLGSIADKHEMQSVEVTRASRSESWLG